MRAMDESSGAAGLDSIYATLAQNESAAKIHQRSIKRDTESSVELQLRVE